MSPYLRSRRKRALDLLACLVLGALSAPVVGVAIVLVRLESPGHPIYRQRRVGRAGEPFELYKLRTMVSGAEQLGLGLAIAASPGSAPGCGGCRSTSCRTC
jgi:lipopolysaccharide/colanic/teichoic acid biosynthesis glycosyltransferase